MTTFALPVRGWSRVTRPDRRPALWLWSVSLSAVVLLVALSRNASGHMGHHAEGSLLRGWLLWSLMVTAMMLPLVTPVVCRVAAGGLWARRRRTVTEVVVGYAAPWLAVGLVGLVVVQVVLPGVAGMGGMGGVAGPRVVAGVLVVAAAWHVAPPRRRLMTRCGAVQPGALAGRRASVDALRNGWTIGVRCVGTCGPAMAVMLLSHGVLLMLGVTLVLWSERVRGPNPADRPARPAQAAALLALAATVLAVA
ncbi:hypothetical protein GCM10022415_12740 [Knoellia locipacati]|uniref:DUF2182 domain-containing protein n=1 Tax=Knoellia locipacati TaxID=882824 RepID=A0A512SZ52_9MICO|nr:DUF2182 domain-containing protein [Knoellia locipacati]GEQ13224.1 hypothetical protein KLO01_12710 [Knoellia locipacati]